MDDTKHLREDQWERIKDSFPGKAGDVGRTGNNRRFIEVVMWFGRTGAPWRSLPLCTIDGLRSTNGSNGGRPQGSGKGCSLPSRLMPTRNG